MPVSSITNRQNYQCNGSSTVFPFPYFFFNPNDLAVYLFDTGSSIVYPQFINTNYTVSGQVTSQGTYPSGGNVVMNSAAPSNLQLIITRNPAQVQNYQLYQNAPINSLGLTTQLDYLTGLVQRLQDEVSRCLQLPDGLGFINPALGSLSGSTFSQVLPQSIALLSSAFQALTVNSGATGWTLSTIPGIGTIIPTTQGGTGNGGPYIQGGILFAVSSSLLNTSQAGAPGLVLTANGSSGPTWTAVSIGSGSVTAGSIQGILGLYQGGTNTGSSYPYPITGLIYASGTGAAQGFAGINPGTVGLPLVCQGSSIPTWQQISFGAISGILSWSQGGTGQNAGYNQDGLIFASGASQFASLTPGGQDQILMGVASSLPVWGPANLSSGSSVTGTLGTSNGGTGQTTYGPTTLLFASSATTFASLPMGTVGTFLQSQGSSTPTWASALSNPMTSSGDLIYGSGASGAAARLPGPTSSSAPSFLTSTGTGAAANAPIWQQFKPPTTSFVTGSSHAGGFSANLSGTYTTPAGCLYLKVRQVGGGGGGGGSCTNGNNTTTGSSGGITVFGSSLVTANGGGGATSNAAGAVLALGGIVTFGSGAVQIVAQTGGGGGSGPNDGGLALFGAGGYGAGSPFFGGGGAGGTPNNAGIAAIGFGGGGGGAGSPSGGLSGYGAGSGGYAEAFIYNPAASYTYSVGLGGAPGLAGSGGLAGASGLYGTIIIEEYYQ